VVFDFFSISEVELTCCNSEVTGSVFFGSSLYLFQRLMDELGVDPHQEDEQEIRVFKSPHTPSFLLLKEKGRSLSISRSDTQRLIARRTPPKYLVIDLTRLHNLDGKNDSAPRLY
jgi:hypothetical protein